MDLKIKIEEEVGGKDQNLGSLAHAHLFFLPALRFCRSPRGLAFNPHARAHTRTGTGARARGRALARAHTHAYQCIAASIRVPQLTDIITFISPVQERNV